MLKLVDLYKKYGKKEAVRGLTLEAKPGEILGLLGPNGAGKTTTLKMAVGLLQPDHGRVEICGIDRLADPLAVKRLVGFVPDEPILYEKLTARGFLNFIQKMYDVQETAYLDLLAQRLDLELDQVISGCSHGMKQKIAVLAALVFRPKVLILDEPMQGLDPRAAFELKELLRQAAGQGVTVVFSTHILEVAEKLCDRVAIVHQGQIRAQGTLAELRTQLVGRTGSDGSELDLEKLFLELTDEKS